MLRFKRTLKLIKYDFAALLKYYWVIALITPIIALASGTLFRGAAESMETLGTDYNMSGMAFAFTLLIALAEMTGGYISSILFGATFLATTVLIFIRFFKHFYTDEGYLTFTLPVSRRELYFSKVISSMTVMLVQSAMIFIGTVLMILVSPPSESGIWLFDADVWRIFFEIMDSFGAWVNLLLVLVNLGIGTVAAIGSIFTELTLLHFCITLGSVIVKRGKVFAAIGCWYLISNLFSYVLSAIYYAMYFLVVASSSFIFNLSITLVLVTCIPLMLMITAIFWTIGFVLYNLTQTLIDKKLNLA